MIQRIVGRITEFFSTSDNVLSRTVRTIRSSVRSLFSTPTHDWARADYEFWRKAYYCRARGLELSGAFIKPLVNKIAAWVLGPMPNWKLESEAASQALGDWWQAHHAEILKAYRAALKQADSLVVVNSDLSVTLVRPDAADPIVSEDDFAEIIGWRVMQTLMHPTEPTSRMTVIDEYYAERRLHRVEINGRVTLDQEFPNLLGRIPIVHIANQTDDGETFGHAEAEGLLEILHRYGVVLEAAIEGNELQGRPTPVANFETIDDLNKFWDNYGETQTQTLPDGTTQTNEVLNVDLSQLLTLSAGNFRYEAPGSFTEDTERLLGLMFYLILEHAEIPEFVFGNAIASSKASAEAQMPVFEKFVEMRRGDIADWLTEIAEIVLGYLALMQPGIGIETPILQWPVMSQDGRLTLDTLTWAFAEGLLDEKTALMLAPIAIEDEQAVLDLAREEREERRQNNPLFQPDNFDQDLADEIEGLEI